MLISLLIDTETLDTTIAVSGLIDVSNAELGAIREIILNDLDRNLPKLKRRLDAIKKKGEQENDR